MPATITNPILKGFNPDPSICRVGEDYYIATSTFEWWPGVQLHHSRDLVNWRLVGHALTRPSQIDLIGNPCSGGVWAPCLSYHDDRFWLIYSNVRAWAAPYKDVKNYLITAPSIEGPWSDPIFLNGSGFDPSLFHDDDGRKWISNQKWDHRLGRNPFDGIVLQEYDQGKGALVGDIHHIFPGTEFGCTEGPHIYKERGWYYLMTAEGGTGPQHVVSLARSKDIHGPYEVHPDNPMITSRFDPDAELTKAGHGSWVETPGGEWFLVHLCSRPLENGRCTLGRETAIQPIVWDEDDWPRLKGGGHRPFTEIEGPDLPLHPFEEEAAPFDAPPWSPHFATLREAPHEGWIRKAEDGVWIRGRESLSSRHHQSLLGLRVQSFHVQASTTLHFEPEDYLQMAGLVFFYDVETYFYLHVRGDEKGNRGLNLKIMDLQEETEAFQEDIRLQPGPVHLMGEMERGVLRFFYRQNEASPWKDIEHVGDASILSDDHGPFSRGGHFTGAFAGIACQDFSSFDKWCRFSDFRIQNCDPSEA